MSVQFYSENYQPTNRAFLHGDAVKVSFFVRHGALVMTEECYFFLMASMRKMRMHIPLSYTLDFFENLFQEKIISQVVEHGIIQFLTFRNTTEQLLSKSDTSYYFEFKPTEDILSIRGSIELDLMKEINVNNNLLSNIHVHCPENIYAEIYAHENDLDDVILLNPNKRIARSIYGNLLFLENNTIKLPKQSEGAYISPLMENFITFVHKKNLAEVDPSELIAFESQKAEEILMISDEKGIYSVKKIRNKEFDNTTFSHLIKLWSEAHDNYIKEWKWT